MKHLWYRYIFALLVSQATITGVFLLKSAHFQSYGMVLAMIFTYSKFRQVRREFDGPRSHSLPLEVATIMDMQRKKEPPESPGEVFKKSTWYIQPVLRAAPIAHPEQPFDIRDVQYGSGGGDDVGDGVNRVQADFENKVNFTENEADDFWNSYGGGEASGDASAPGATKRRIIGEKVLNGDLSFDADRQERDLLKEIAKREIV